MFAVAVSGTVAYPACTLSITPQLHASELISGKAMGLLNGMNATAPSDDVIAKLKPSMWRGPMQTWLWPNASMCKGPGTCCTPAACPAPFAEAGRLATLGAKQQYILNAVHTGMGDCEWRSYNKQPHQCSLPGGPSDLAFKKWEYSITSATNEAKRRGILDVGALW
jgi:hypothetical protein